MSIEYKVIGRHIRTARKRKNMTQEDVAAAIEMSPAHFGKVERGDRPVNLQRLSQLSQVLDVPLEKLVEGAAIADDGSTVSKTGFTGNTDFIDSNGIAICHQPTAAVLPAGRVADHERLVVHFIRLGQLVWHRLDDGDCWSVHRLSVAAFHAGKAGHDHARPHPSALGVSGR